MLNSDNLFTKGSVKPSGKAWTVYGNTVELPQLEPSKDWVFINK